jgi:hypothetical protein
VKAPLRKARRRSSVVVGATDNPPTLIAIAAKRVLGFWKARPAPKEGAGTHLNVFRCDFGVLFLSRRYAGFCLGRDVLVSAHLRRWFQMGVSGVEPFTYRRNGNGTLSIPLWGMLRGHLCRSASRFLGTVE